MHLSSMSSFLSPQWSHTYGAVNAPETLYLQRFMYVQFSQPILHALSA